MAIYHLEAKVVSRGTGRSAVAASAYLSCSKILNDYDGVQHDYTRKKGLVWQDVFLPEFAPHEWERPGCSLERCGGKRKRPRTARLAREFVPALPIELTTGPMAGTSIRFHSRTALLPMGCALTLQFRSIPARANPMPILW